MADIHYGDSEPPIGRLLVSQDDAEQLLSEGLGTFKTLDRRPLRATSLVGTAEQLSRQATTKRCLPSMSSRTASRWPA